MVLKKVMSFLMTMVVLSTPMLAGYYPSIHNPTLGESGSGLLNQIMAANDKNGTSFETISYLFQMNNHLEKNDNNKTCVRNGSMEHMKLYIPGGAKEVRIKFKSIVPTNFMVYFKWNTETITDVSFPDAPTLSDQTSLLQGEELTKYPIHEEDEFVLTKAQLNARVGTDGGWLYINVAGNNVLDPHPNYTGDTDVLLNYRISIENNNTNFNTWLNSELFFSDQNAVDRSDKITERMFTCDEAENNNTTTAFERALDKDGGFSYAYLDPSFKSSDQIDCESNQNVWDDIDLKCVELSEFIGAAGSSCIKSGNYWNGSTCKDEDGNVTLPDTQTEQANACVAAGGVWSIGLEKCMSSTGTEDYRADIIACSGKNWEWDSSVNHCIDPNLSKDWSSEISDCIQNKNTWDLYKNICKETDFSYQIVVCMNSGKEWDTEKKECVSPGSGTDWTSDIVACIDASGSWNLTTNTCTEKDWTNNIVSCYKVPGKVWDTNTNKCIVEGTDTDWTSDIISCLEGKGTWDNSNNICLTKNFSTEIDECYKTENMVWDNDKKECVEEDFNKDWSTEIADCYKEQNTWDDTRKLCVITDWLPDIKSCVDQENMVWDNDKKVCTEKDFNKDWSSEILSCLEQDNKDWDVTKNTCVDHVPTDSEIRTSAGAVLAEKPQTVQGFFFKYGEDAYDWVYVTYDLQNASKLTGVDENTSETTWKPLQGEFIKSFSSITMPKDRKTIVFGSLLNTPGISKVEALKLAGKTFTTDGMFVKFGTKAFDWVYTSVKGNIVAKLTAVDSVGNINWTMLKGEGINIFSNVNIYPDKSKINFTLKK